MTPNTCPECFHSVKETDKYCGLCGYKIIAEPTEKQREHFLKGPSLGALLWTQGWAFGARLYLWFFLSLIPILGFVVLFVLLFWGRRLSWKQGSWSSWEEYKGRMRFLNILSVIWIILLLGVYFFSRYAN